MNKGLFLDRDGTLIIDKNYLYNPAEVELLPSVKNFLIKAQEQGYLLFLLTNQSGVGRGYYEMRDVIACNNKMLSLLDLTEDIFKGVCIATEGPEDEILYRKPSPKYINEMVEAYDLDREGSWMIGDRLSDLQAGIQAGINALWISTGNPYTSELESYIKTNHCLKADNLEEFIDRLTLGAGRVR